MQFVYLTSLKRKAKYHIFLKLIINWICCELIVYFLMKYFPVPVLAKAIFIHDKYKQADELVSFIL